MTAPLKDPKTMTTCPTCKSPVRVDRLEKHLKKHNGGVSDANHSVKSSTAFKKNPKGVKPYKLTKPKPPGHARCPYCNEFYRLNEINAHKAGCPKNVYQMGTPKATKLKQTAQEDQTHSNRCSNCGNIISERNTGHTRFCPLNGRVQTGVPRSKPPVKTGRLLIDEYGVVRSYSSWLNDQRVGESSNRHISSSQSSLVTGGIYTTCPVCSVRLRKSRLSKHISSQHQQPKE